MNYYNEETHPDQKYFLSKKSEKFLDQINPAMAEVVRRAQAISDVQLKVIHGKRISKQQTEFFRKGVTQGSNSPHMYGTAVDVLAVIEGRICPEAETLDEVATSMKYAAADLNTPIRWGGAWQITNLANFNGMLEDAQNWYLEDCVKENVRPQLDPWHFELSVDE